MTPEFAKAVDPVFLHVLGLMERIERGENPSPENERHRIGALLEQAEAKRGQSQDWQLAKYALVSWIDEVMLDAPWNGRDWWENNALEVQYFRTRLRNEDFYNKSQQAAALPQRDALEVFYLCVVLGFRGLYRNPAAAMAIAQSRNLPPNLEAWAKQASTAIRLGQGRPVLRDAIETAEGAKALTGRNRMIWSLLAAVILAALAAGLALVKLSSGS